MCSCYFHNSDDLKLQPHNVEPHFSQVSLHYGWLCEVTNQYHMTFWPHTQVTLPILNERIALEHTCISKDSYWWICLLCRARNCTRYSHQCAHVYRPGNQDSKGSCQVGNQNSLGSIHPTFINYAIIII